MALPSLRSFALCLALLLPAQLAAGAEDTPLWSSLRLEASSPASALRHEPLGQPSLRRAAGQASSSAVRGLRLWAEGAGFAVGRRPAGYRLGAGASLPVADSLTLTAGYRLTGFSGGSEVDGDTLDVDGHMGGAYFGFNLEF